MSFTSNAVSVTTVLLIAFALFVIYMRVKNWLDSNVPIFFYTAMIVYLHSVENNLPVWLIYAGFGLGLLLRFEFMNAFFIRIVKVLEICVLLIIVYLCLASVIQF